ncbi:hypothetical protein RCL1_006790 [Eukaryota sp. TZLM3-RCL]
MTAKLFTHEQQGLLLAAIRTDNRSLSSIFNSVIKHFNTEPLKFSAGCHLLIFLEDDSTLSTTDRIAALFVLHTLFAGNHPFVASVADAVRLPSTSDNERAFVQQLFANAVVTSKTPAQILQELTPPSQSQPLPFLQPSQDLSVPSLLRLTPTTDSIVSSTAHASVLQSPSDFFSKLTPQFIRPPPFVPQSGKELPNISWTPLPILPPMPLWLDFTAPSESVEDNSELLDMLEAACKTALSSTTLDRLFLLINHSSPTILTSLLSPSRFPALLDNNFIAAVEFLETVLKRVESSEEIINNPYLDVLSSLTPSLKTLDCVNRLANKHVLPQSFITKYLTHVLAVVHDASNESPHQYRLARLTTVWTLSLIRSNLLSIEEVFLDLQRLCVNFAGKFQEASVLLKQLQEWRSKE